MQYLVNIRKPVKQTTFNFSSRSWGPVGFGLCVLEGRGSAIGGKQTGGGNRVNRETGVQQGLGYRGPVTKHFMYLC